LTIYNGYCQDNTLKKATKQYDKFAYIDAIETFESLTQKGYQSAEIYSRLGNANYFNSNFEKQQNGMVS